MKVLANAVVIGQLLCGSFATAAQGAEMEDRCVEDVKGAYNSLRDHLNKSMVFHAEDALLNLARLTEACSSVIILGDLQPDAKSEAIRTIENWTATGRRLFSDATRPFPLYVPVQRYFAREMQRVSGLCQNGAPPGDVDCETWQRLGAIPVENLGLMTEEQLRWLEFEVERMGHRS